MKVLFITPVPIEGAGTRARLLQYLPYLQAEGIEADVRPFLFTAFFHIAYAPGQWGKKAWYGLRSTWRRLGDCLRARQYDLIYLYRECLPFGPPIGEWLLVRSGRPVVYDLDDAVHLPDPRAGWRRQIIEAFKWRSKVAWMIRRSAHVVVGNAYLGEYAGRWHAQVTVLPTPENPDRFPSRQPTAPGAPLTIGWIGSHSTAPYLAQLTPVFQRLAQRFEFTLTVIGSGASIVMPGVRIHNIRWQLDQEAEAVAAFDIGVYPLSGAEFDLGKACYKAILYMAAGVPVVASRHGANPQIIRDGDNGLLAGSEAEWVDQLSRLLTDQDLRQRLAVEGRRTVAQRYAVAVQAPRFLTVLERACGRRPVRDTDEERLLSTAGAGGHPV